MAAAVCRGSLLQDAIGSGDVMQLFPVPKPPPSGNRISMFFSSQNFIVAFRFVTFSVRVSPNKTPCNLL